jgi:RND family efflux transporter MFP subunit
MPLWVQLVASLVVIAVALGLAGLFNDTANTMLARLGVPLPLLNAPAAAAGGQQAAQTSTQPTQGQRQGQGAGAQQGQAGARQGQGNGQFGNGQFAGRGGNRTAVVVAVAATSGKINDKLTAIGEGSAIRAVTVTAPSGGTLLALAVKPGDRVAAGQALATLDSATQQNALDRAKLATSDADAALARAESLAATNSIASTQLDAARLAAENAKLAEQVAQLALDQRTIVTPIAGTVGLIQVSPGNQIGAQTVVTTVQDNASILVNFWVPERYAGQIAVGQAVTANSVALPGQRFDGTITAVDNQIDPESRTLQVQATLPNADGSIRPGMSFSVDMSFAGEVFPVVDPLAIQWSNAGAYVWKIVDGKVQKGMVEIVQRNSDGVLVNGDVKEGDQVVTQGVLQLSDGLAVRLLDAPVDGQGQAAAGQASQAPAAQGQAASDAAGASNASQHGQGHQGNFQRRNGGQGNGGQNSAAAAPAAGG